MYRQAETDLSALIESSEDLIWSVDVDRRLIAFNGALRRHIQATYGAEVEVGMRVEDLLPPERAALWPPLYDRVLTEGTFRTEYSLLDGRMLELVFNSIIVPGKAIGVSVFGRDITEREQAKIRLRESEERNREIFEHAAVGIVYASFESGILRCNERFAEIIGYPLEEISGLTFEQVTAPEDQEETTQALKGLTAGATGIRSWDKRFVRKDGSLIWARVTISVHRDPRGGVLHYVAVVEDINSRKIAEEHLAAALDELRVSEERYRTVFQTSPDIVTISRLSDGAYIEVNKAFYDASGFESKEVIGRTSLEINFWTDPHDRRSFVQELRRTNNVRNVEYQFRRKDGEIFSALVSASVIEIDGVPSVLSIARDISEAKEAAEKIRDLAFYDTLTHLPNRRLLMDRLGQTPGARARGFKRALFFVDIDGFKRVNETLGHQAGDLLLQEVAQRLIACVR